MCGLTAATSLGLPTIVGLVSFRRPGREVEGSIVLNTFQEASSGMVLHSVQKSIESSQAGKKGWAPVVA